MANNTLQLTSQYAVSLRCTMYCRSAELGRYAVKNKNDIYMKIDNDLGNIVVISPDGDESHIIPPEFNEFDDNKEIQNNILTVVQKELGAFEDVDEFNFEEQKSTGLYTVDGKSYTASKYKLDVLEDELYVGASSGTEQIILTILGGATGGIAGAITAQIYNAVANKLQNNSTQFTDEVTLEEKLKKIEKILLKRFNAKKPIQFDNIKTTPKTLKCTVIDSNNIGYTASIKNSNQVLLLDISKNA